MQLVGLLQLSSRFLASFLLYYPKAHYCEVSKDALDGALGVEQLVVDLKGDVESGMLANINNPTVKETYIIGSRHWLNQNVPNWEHILKFQ